jgi:ribosomal protein S18 acetylase RimI-like enzyme
MSSRFIVQPIAQCPVFIPIVTKELQDFLQTQEDQILNDREELTDYVKEFTYVMLDTHPSVKLMKPVGFFSLSRMDCITSIGLLQQGLSLLLSYVNGRMYVYDVCVFKAYRGQGYGLILMQLIEHYCQNHFPSVSTLELHTNEHKLAYFYNKCGYKLARKHTPTTNVFSKKIT